MNSRQIIILLAGTIAIIFEKVNAVCIEQLSSVHFNEKETSTNAFERAFNNLCVPKNRIFTVAREQIALHKYINMRVLGILYEYLDHLYSAAVAVYKHVFIEEPIKWCTLNIHEFHNVIGNGHISVCTSKVSDLNLMGSASYTEYTNAKNPKDFCNGYKPNESKIPVQIVKQFVIDSIQQYYQPPAQQNEHFVSDPIQPSQPFPKQKTEHFVCDPSHQNHQSPALRTENVVFDSSSHQFVQESQKYKHRSIDLNQQPSVSSPPIYSDEYFSFHDNQVGTSTSYMENGKTLGLDLNKSPPKDKEED